MKVYCSVCKSRKDIRLIHGEKRVGKNDDLKVFGCSFCKNLIKLAHHNREEFNKDIEYDEQFDLNQFLRLNFLDKWKDEESKKAIILWSGWILE